MNSKFNPKKTQYNQNALKLKKRRLYLKKKRQKALKRVYTVALFSLSATFIIATSGAFAVLNYLQNRIEEIPFPEEVFAEVKLATEIVDRNGARLYRLHGDESNSDNVSITNISNSTKAVFLAAEDSNFYNHDGINPDAILRCSFKNLSAKKTACGGSTITQQVVKITTKQNAPTVKRKVDEILLASQVEQKYSKDEILELYFRITPYGSNITGIKTAAKFYYGITDLKKLTVEQSVMLAAIINDPVNLSPTLSPDLEKAREELKIREEYIFKQLREKIDNINMQIVKNNNNLTPPDLLTKEQIELAEDKEVEFIPPKLQDVKAGHFVNYALQELQKRGYNNGKPFTLDELRNGGFKIYTSLDYKLQKKAEKHVKRAGNNYKHWNVYNAAVMTTIPSTGEIITMAGSKSFYSKSEACEKKKIRCKFDPQVNVLTSLQSPGSTNKPIGYYKSFETGKLSPGAFLPDIPISFGGYNPKNWDGSYLGTSNATAREMLRASRNIPAIMVVRAIGVKTYIDTARKFGYTTYKNANKYGESIILGGADVYPVEHAQAYGVFANGGDLVKLNPIKKIEDRNGKVIYTAKPEKTRVADPAAVYLLNQVLYNYDVGTGVTISWDGRPVAGKTGTTENNRDSFLMMYSPDFVTLGWAGNNNNDPLNYLYGWPAFTVTPWLKDYMSEIGTSKYFNKRSQFKKPSNVYVGTNYTSDWLISGREPASSFGKSPVPEFQKFLDAYLGGRKKGG